MKSIRPELIGGRGTLHGGVIAALVDSLGAFHAAVAAQSHMRAHGDEGDAKRPFRVSALDHHLDYLRPLIGKSFTASTTVLHAGSQVVRIRADVVNDAGELAATAADANPTPTSWRPGRYGVGEGSTPAHR